MKWIILIAIGIFLIWKMSNTTKSVSTLSMPPKRLSMTPNKKMKASTSASKQSNEEVFPLNEDDLKEF